MPAELIEERPSADAPPPVRPRRTRVRELPEVRWAALATAAFLPAFPLDLAGAPAWLWGPLYAVCYAAGGWEPGLAGLRALKERALDVDLLMVVAALGAAAIGQFLDGALLIVIFAVSGALEAFATRRTADSVRGLLDLAPDTAARITPGGAEERVDVSALRVGDTVLVRPGERLPADGTVREGMSDVQQAGITGEPLPVDKGPGDEVFAGTLNGTGALRVTVDRDASASVIARIVAMVEEASERKAPGQLFIERIEQRYAIGVVAATLALFAVPLAFGADLTETLLRAMTFMIVASPCAVVLATMPPLLSAIATCGRHGVLVKSAAAMERLGAVTRVALDKTGTLTEESARVRGIRALPDSGLTEDEALALAAAAERPSEHPLARAVVAAARERGLRLEPAADFTSAPGRGVRAVVTDHTVQVGSPTALLDGAPPDCPGARVRTDIGDGPIRTAVAEVEDSGATAVAVLVDGRPVAVLAIAAPLRAGAAEAVASLGRLTGTPPVLLTGDNKHAAARLGEEVGITDVRAGLLPQDKVTTVRGWEDAGERVLMVGDGVNDAPALAAAHAGVAMGRAGSALTLETADAVVVRDELAAVPAVVTLSRRARRLVAQNLVIACVCIGALVVWDLFGHLPLPLGVAGHEGSTVLVGLNGLRLLRTSAWPGAARARRPAAGG
ncbi:MULTISPECIES: heavy metal translocating P-type ATPase [Streptomyces]|uniref:ATPase, P-type (Transporting), HAD superfamily, subfamily IC/heavy metal translocating P-type ATPase n=1 Tax=Streptomyces melanosporofaciens TaxID=67327 RepID=A0A1H5B147_STRMJ|nr:heavy metal translocating P-type ATPase [Streptomyces melanosporofaciens]SED47630.1 ATPase, P-type (transporting), HAD superfamily, subfamily IC/heavy metal translocating P-type ATPase [Streptomyces melanosporofaciens]